MRRLLALALAAAADLGGNAPKARRRVSFQDAHGEISPASALRRLAADCERLGITAWDRYGDFDSSPSDSWLRRFEQEVATELGKEDAVFMPSGGMAQSIALLIHREQRPESSPRTRFTCHATSHLLLHEQEAYHALLGMTPVVVGSDVVEEAFLGPMTHHRVAAALAPHADEVSTLLLELPHRELGGKCTPWEDVLAMSRYCRARGIAFHCDGARLFEATAHYRLSPAELAAPFDSVYLSFYKGLGGLSCAMLLGSSEFCVHARVWLRRFGGNLYTLLPLAVSGYAGYRRHWCLEPRTSDDDTDTAKILSFTDKRIILASVVADLQAHSAIHRVVTFDPPVPETNMVHGYLRAAPEECTAAFDRVARRTELEVVRRIRPVPEDHPAFGVGYRSFFEWTMGEHNARIPRETFLEGWVAVAEQLENRVQSDDKPKP